MAVDLSGLNPAQRAAVTAPQGFHLVVAGAGTGKTRTLVHRVAWLVQQGEDPSGIVLLTFTRRAAAEMLDRAAALVGPSARRVQGGTFHAFASRTMRPFAASVGRSPDYTVLDRADAEDLVAVVRQASGLVQGSRRFPNKRTLLNMISRQANLGCSLGEAIEAVNPRYAEDEDDIAEIARLYAQRKAHGDLVDYDDLLVLFRDLLRSSPDARRRITGGCQHVLVDEYQDTNKIQGHIAALLATGHGDLMVVGDEAQSIYRFRGARVENILEFPERFKGARVTVLEDNYRSTQPVLDLANGVLAGFSSGFAKALRAHTTTPAPSKPRLVHVSTVHEEAEVVVASVLALREAGVPLSEQAVLFRSSHHSIPLEAALSAANVPFRKFGGLRFTDAAHVKDVVALLRLVANPRDEVAWARVLPWLPGLGDKTAASIARAVLAAQPPRLDPAPWAGKRYGPALAELAALLDELSGGSLDQQVDGAVAYVREGLPDRYEDAHKRARDLEALALLTERHADLEGFLAEVALDPPEAAEVDADEAEDEWLTLSTVHSAKGLEWTAVTLLHLADGAFPSGYALDDPEALEEERRLLYVAVTRARRELTLYRPRFVQGRGAWGVGPGCLLLDDIPDLAARVTEIYAAGEAWRAPDATRAEGTDQRLDEVLAWIED